MEQETNVEILLLVSFLRNVIPVHWLPYSPYILAGPVAPFPILSSAQLHRDIPKGMEVDVFAKSASFGSGRAPNAPCWCPSWNGSSWLVWSLLSLLASTTMVWRWSTWVPRDLMKPFNWRNAVPLLFWVSQLLSHPQLCQPPGHFWGGHILQDFLLYSVTGF